MYLPLKTKRKIIENVKKPLKCNFQFFTRRMENHFYFTAILFINKVSIFEISTIKDKSGRLVYENRTGERAEKIKGKAWQHNILLIFQYVHVCNDRK